MVRNQTPKMELTNRKDRKNKSKNSRSLLEKGSNTSRYTATNGKSERHHSDVRLFKRLQKTTEQYPRVSTEKPNQNGKARKPSEKRSNGLLELPNRQRPMAPDSKKALQSSDTQS